MSLQASPILSAFARMSASTTNSNNVNQTESADTQPPQSPNPEHGSNNSPNSRQAQVVLTNTNRAKIAKWMIEREQQDDCQHVVSKAVAHFSQFFRGSTKANLMRASRYWKQRNQLVQGHTRISKNNNISFVKLTRNGLKRHYCKSKKGRGRPITPWVVALQADLVDEFNRMRKAGVKFNARLLRTLSFNLIGRQSAGAYHPNMRDPHTNCLIKDHITARWIQTFMERHGIVSRYQCGKLMVSPAKQEQIEREVSYHLGQLSRDFNSNSLHEEDVFNADETHFCMNMDNHKTLALIGEKSVRYADVVSGDDGITMMVLISGGPHATLDIPMLIFKNADRNYPIRGLPDNVPGVVYRTGPKAWMDKRVFLQWLLEKRVFTPLPNGRKRVLFLDNVNTHAVTDDVRKALSESNTEIRFFPCNATHLVQPADSFLIQKLKTYWRREWDEHKMGLLEKNMWSEGSRASGKLTNPGKQYFLKLAATSVRAVSAQRDEEGVSYARKAMIRCGMARNLNGLWEERQLFPELQAIVNKYRANFEGEVVGAS